MARRTVITNVALASALFGALAITLAVVSDPAAAEDEAPRTATATTSDVIATVSATGNLAAATSVGVDFAGTGGTVTNVYVEVGDNVDKGEALAKIDDRSPRQQVQQAEASLRQARAQLAQANEGQTSAERARDSATIESAETTLANARRQLQQAKDTRALDRGQQQALVDSARANYDAATTPEAKDAAEQQLEQARRTQASTNLRNDQAVDTSEGQVTSAQRALDSAKASASVNGQPARQSSIDAAEAQVASAQAQLTSAKNALADTVLRAPVDGTVATIAAGVGESSTASASSGGSSTGGSTSGAVSTTATGFVVLTSLDTLQVTSRIAEADAGDVEVGQAAAVRFEAAGKDAEGTVTGIDIIETVTDNVVEYGVTVTLYNAPSGLRIGQSSDVTIRTATAKDVVTVPSAAVTTATGISSVTVLEEDGTERRATVETGIVGEAGTEIVRGLKVGDTVVLPETAGGAGGFTFPGGAPPGLGGLGGGLG